MKAYAEKINSNSLLGGGMIFLFEGLYDFLPATYVEDEKKRNGVMTEIKALPENYQVALLGRYFMGFDCEELASALELDPMQAASRLMRAEAMLKGRVEKAVGTELPYVPIPEDNEPMLTKLYRADADAVVTPEMLERVLSKVREKLYGSDANGDERYRMQHDREVW